MRNRQYSSLVGQLDLFMNIAVGMALLFVLTFSMINVSKKSEEGIIPAADFLITLDWNPESNVDIDLWMRDPDGKLVGFVNKSIPGMFLDRDDLGYQHDIITDANGNERKISINQEVMTIRGFKPGKYTVAAHYFNNKKSTPGTKDANDISAPEKLSISVLKLQPFNYVYKNSGIMIEKEGQEVTLLSFIVRDDGSVESVSTEPDYFVNDRNK